MNLHIDDSFINLIKDVRIIRSDNKMCLSAQPRINVSRVLETIINNDVYKKDYNGITRDLLFEIVTYEEALATLKVIMNTGIF